MTFEQELGQKIFDRLDPIALEASLAFITTFLVISLFFNQDTSLKYLKYMISSLLFFSFTIFNVVFFIDEKKSELSVKVYELKVLEMKEKNSKVKELHKKQIIEYQDSQKAIEELLNLTKNLYVLMLFTIVYLWILSLKSLATFYNDLLHKSVFVIFCLSLLCMFLKLQNIILVLTFLFSFLYLFWKYQSKFYKKNTDNFDNFRKKDFLKINVNKK